VKAVKKAVVKQELSLKRKSQSCSWKEEGGHC